MGAFPLLTPNLLDTTEDVFDFTQSLADTLGPLGTSADGFDLYLSDTLAIVNAGIPIIDTLDGDLGLAVGIAGTIDTHSLDGDVASLPQTIADGNAILSDAGALLGAVGPPTPPSGGGGGGGGTASSDCSQRTNQYGLSVIGTFHGVTCDIKQQFKVIRVQDGPCTFSSVVSNFSGTAGVPNIFSFTLQSGDPTVFKLGRHTATNTDGSKSDLYDITVTPKLLSGQSKSHFDAVGVLSINQAPHTLHVCISLDCIP